MRQLAHSSARVAAESGTDAFVCQPRVRSISARIVTALLSLAILLAISSQQPISAQQPLKHEGDSWVRTYTGTIPAAARLRVNGHGPVTLTAGVGREIGYTVKVSVMARTEAEARRMLDRESIHAEVRGDSAVLTTPGGAAMSATIIRAPHLTL